MKNKEFLAGLPLGNLNAVTLEKGNSFENLSSIENSRTGTRFRFYKSDQGLPATGFMFCNFLMGLCLLASCTNEGGPEKELQAFSGTAVEQMVSITKDNFPSYNANYLPPPGAPEIFSLSQDYPDQSVNENHPWLSVDFKKKPMEYMKLVLDYSLEGNVEVGFKGQDNPVRKWYHSPWLHDDGKYSNTGKYIGNGREYIHGLTRERSTPKFEMHKKQDVPLENWAVGMYNSPGGYTLGKVWDLSGSDPKTKLGDFPEGTVACKLLFTDGDTNKLPFLGKTLEWTANIYPGDPSKPENQKRINRTVRLVQIDIAIKDNRATETGWVFGTFIYDAAHPGKNVWERMVPVGLSWGDDSGVTADLNKEGAFVNKELKQTFINAKLIKESTNERQAYMTHHGLGGRMNGPVDNPISSCISCHGQAGVDKKGSPLPLAPFQYTRANYPIDSFKLYFANVKPGAYTRTFQGKEYTNLDYSLQLSAGIRNFYNNENIKNEMLAMNKQNDGSIKQFTVQDVTKAARQIKALPEVTRGE